MATCMSARSERWKAPRPSRYGEAASAPDRGGANIVPAPPISLIRRVAISRRHGACFWRTAPRLTSRHGATIGTGHARKYAMWERGEKLPTQKPNSTMRCPCGELFYSHRLEHSVLHVPHITEHHREMRRRPSLR